MARDKSIKKVFVSDLARIVTEKCKDEYAKVSAPFAKKFATELFASVVEQVREGNVVDIGVLGTFSIKETKQRRGINPKTKESIVISGKKLLAFKAKPSVKEIK